jgi:hypothetical protein
VNDSDKIATVKLAANDDMGLGCDASTDMAVVISDISEIVADAADPEPDDNGRTNWFFYVTLN